MKKNNNSSGVHIEGSNISAKHLNIAGGDIIQNQPAANITPQAFQDLITEIQSSLKRLDLNPDDKQGVDANLSIAKNQAKKEKPNGATIVSSLTTALNLITQAGGAAKAVETILPLIQKAIVFAQNLF